MRRYRGNKEDERMKTFRFLFFFCLFISILILCHIPSPLLSSSCLPHTIPVSLIIHRCPSTAATGGDTNGYPGIKIYQQGIVLIAVVSTGSKYWQASAVGAVPHNKWTNVGLRWAAPVGLEVGEIGTWRGPQGAVRAVVFVGAIEVSVNKREVWDGKGTA